MNEGERQYGGKAAVVGGLGVLSLLVSFALLALGAALFPASSREAPTFALAAAVCGGLGILLLVLAFVVSKLGR